MSEEPGNAEFYLRRARRVFAFLVCLGIAMMVLGFVGSVVAYLGVDPDEIEYWGEHDTYLAALSANPQARQGVCIFVGGLAVVLAASYGLRITRPATFQPWFRYSLLTMFVVMTIGCMALSWLISNLAWIRNRHAAQEWIHAHGRGGSIFVPYEVRPELPWSLWILGEKPMGFLPVNENKGERLKEFHKDVERLQRLFPESQIVDLTKPLPPWVLPKDE